MAIVVATAHGVDIMAIRHIPTMVSGTGTTRSKNAIPPGGDNTEEEDQEDLTVHFLFCQKERVI